MVVAGDRRRRRVCICVCEW